MRVVNRVVASVLALALLVGGVLVAVEIVVAGLDRRPWVLPHDHWYRSARQRAWESPPARWAFIALVLAGLLLLFLQAARRRPLTLALVAGDAPADLNRRSLERSLARSVSGVDGVAGSRVRLDDGRLDVSATTHRRQAGDIESQVTGAVERRMEPLGLARRPAVRVKVRTRSDR